MFIREGHPAMWALDETVQDRLVMGWPYFETADPNIFESQGTYAKPAEGEAEPHVFKHTREIVWNHGIGETVMALLDVGMRLWLALGGILLFICTIDVEVGRGSAGTAPAALILFSSSRLQIEIWFAS